MMVASRKSLQEKTQTIQGDNFEIGRTETHKLKSV